MKVYAIFSGCYSDWKIHGYFENKDDAEKYCATQNAKSNGNWDSYYVVEINQMTGDFKNTHLKYYHEVVFDFNTGMRIEPDRYEYYIGADKMPLSEYVVFKKGNGWISFNFNCDSRERADKFATFLDKYHECGSYDLAAKALGAISR